MDWTRNRASKWYKTVGVIRGCNICLAVNMTEMWQSETFSPKTINQELGWAEKASYNSARIFLPYLVGRTIRKD